MTEDTSKLTLQAIADMAESVQTYVSGQLQNNTGSFTDLSDTPSDFTAGKYLRVNDVGDALEYVDEPSGGGSSYFTGLLDTPNDYTNQAGKYVRVSEQEDGLDFIASSELLGLGTVDGYDFCADFHLQSNTTNNSSSFQDLSYDPYNIGSQNVIHSTSITPIYGSSSLYFNGDARLSVGGNSTFSTLSKKLINNYTVQFWINPVIGSQNQPIMGTAGQSTDHGFRILLRSDNKVQFDVFKGLTNDASVTLVSSSAININSWTHVALINSNNVLTFYINGTSSGSINWTQEGTNITPTYPLLIGGLPLDNIDTSYLDGYMQDIRIDRTAFNTQYFPPQELTVSQCNANQSELTFSSLRDTPVNYSNAGGKYVRVSENESQLEYVGITVAGSTNNEFSNNFLTGNITTNEIINELSYGGLDIGKTYRLSTTLCLNADSASDFPKVDFYNGDRKVISLFSKGSTSTVSNSMLFVARDQNIFASGRNLSSTAYIMGDPEISFMQLELPPSVAVELDEEVILPPSTGAGGIFSIADIKSNTIIENQNNLSDFTQIIQDLNEEIGGPTGVMLIGDIKLNTIIEKGYDFGGSEELLTGAQVDENGDPVAILKIADVKANAIISQEYDGQSNFTGEMPLFSVLNIGDMKTLSTIQQTGMGDDQTIDFPTGAFDWQNI